MENFYTLLSNTGINAIIAARASNSEVKLTKIAVGDGDIIPSQDMTALKSEKHRFNINSIIQDIDNPNYLIVEGVIPSNVGGFYVSEVAIYTDQNTLFAIGSLPKTYKPLLEEGSAKDLTIKIFLEVTNADSVTLKVDDSVVLATRKFVLSELKKYALINGDETKKFKVADAVETNEAVNKKQFDDTAVKLTGNQTVAGVKTFSSSPIVPTPTLGGAAVNKDYVDNLRTIATGTATFTATTNNINLTGIGIGVEIGDVIQISGATDSKNNSEFTVEVITDNDNIIVNQAHANKGTAKNVATRESDTGVTVKLLAKWYNASDSLGRDWVNVTANRTAGTTYPNITNRGFNVEVVAYGTHTNITRTVGNNATTYSNSNSGSWVVAQFVVPKGDSYSITVTAGNISSWKELR
ncbi:phage tail protein [Aliarcobacter butzleri]|uniref:phage tail protein n=1 Tax=Aliarcobacter butzleri TaxID=28197 RepID=UPI001ED9C8F6|nr:phage tail protein [Aliarcobacter butzleri]MCG3685347.1 phage tail protein [Aliarcobacter butzleri]